MSRILRILILAALLCGVASPQARSQQAAQAPYDFKANYVRSSFYIPMRDGVRLYTNIYSPKDQSQKYPFLITRTPYGSGPYAPGEFGSVGRALLPMAREGYIFVTQDVRGRNYSEGDFEDVRPLNANPKAGKAATDESTDAYDTIDWLVKCIPNNNGRAGIWGISYPGFYAGAAGVNSHPALKAISPEAPVSDWFIGDDDHHNGAFFLLDFVGFFNGFGRPRTQPGVPGTSYKPSMPMNMQNDAYAFYLKLGSLKNVDANYYHGEVKHWTEVQDHPNYDAFWKDRALPAHLKDVKCASLLVGGWYDAEDMYGPLGDYAAIRKLNPGAQCFLVEGPWPHGGWAGGDFAGFGDESFGMKTGAWYRDNVFKPFFDYYLKDTGSWSKPGATVFDTGLNQWWTFDAWPPKDSTPLALSSAPGRGLTISTGAKLPGASKGVAGEYVSDPANPVPYIAQTQGRRRNEYLNDDQRFAGARPDVLSFQTSPLTEDISIAGPIRADLFVTTTGSDSDFVVKVIDVMPEGDANAGYERLVRADVMRGRFRESFSTPKAFTPGKETEVAFDLRDVAHTFLKGHRIMIQIQSSWFPLVDRNPQTYVPNIYKADEMDFQKETIRITHFDVILPQLMRLPQPLPVAAEYRAP